MAVTATIGGKSLVRLLRETSIGEDGSWKGQLSGRSVRESLGEWLGLFRLAMNEQIERHYGRIGDRPSRWPVNPR